MNAWVALIPLLVLVSGSLVYCVLTLLAARNYLNSRPTALHGLPPLGLPPITVMKPLFGADEGLSENLRGFFKQDYPDYQILMAVTDEKAPETAIARELMREYPAVPATIVATGPSPRPNGKVFALEHLMPEVRHSILVMSDSDIRVTPDMLRVLAAEMQEPNVDLVTCPYRAKAGASFWSRLEAIGMNAEFLGGVLVARYLNGMDFALGCTLAIRLEALQSIGGWQTLRDYLAEDFMMGKLIAQSGNRVVLSSYVIEHRIGSQSFSANLEHRMRWARSTRRSRPWGYAGEIFTRTLALALILACAFPAWWPLSALAIFFRFLVAGLLAGPVLKCRKGPEFWLLLPIQDIVSFLCWVGGFFGNTILWRGRKLTVQPDGTF